MYNTLALISGTIAVAAVVPYIRDILRHKTRPNVVSWFTWSLLNVIVALAAFAGHAMQTALFAAVTGLCTAAVTALGFTYGIKKYTVFDAMCQVFALLSIALWLLTHDPLWAVVLTISASGIASLPTIRHAWLKAREETWQYYVLGGIAAVFACFAVQRADFLSLAFPVYLLIDEFLIAAIVLARTRRRR